MPVKRALTTGERLAGVAVTLSASAQVVGVLRGQMLRMVVGLLTGYLGGWLVLSLRQPKGTEL